MLAAGIARLGNVLSAVRSDLSPVEAAKLASNPFAAGLDRRDFAAWTTLARVLLNLDEFITRE